MGKEENQRVESQLFSDLVVGSFLGDVEIDGFKGLTKLDAATLKAESPDDDAKAKRFELISAVRSGRHVELSVAAQTFEQTAKPNRRFLRLADDKLASRAPTWKGQPYLTGHDTWNTSAMMGTILSSKAIASDGAVAFEQKLSVVNPEAVVGILNGTFNKFSIGWWPAGAVLCSVHGCDVISNERCGCWPGETVKLDGKDRTVEFVFSDFRGKETSTVVIPAVQNTNVGEVRAALAAELHIPSTRQTRKIKESTMLFHRLAVALGLTALSEALHEDAALAAVSALQARAATAENQLTTNAAQLALAESAVKTLTAAQVGVQIDAILQTEGFSAGRLRASRDATTGQLTVGPVEKWLRELGASAGLEVMKAQLAQMPVIALVGKNQANGAQQPAITTLGAGEATASVDNPYLANAAALTGQKVEDLVAFSNGHVKGAL